jgi:cytochrome c-type biogenesis protein CcmH
VNIVLVLAIAALCLGTLALLVLPLLRIPSRQISSRAAFDVRVYRDQLAEIDRDAARGLLGPAEAEAARAEVKHRLLSVVDAAEQTRQASAPAQERRRRALPASIALLLPATAIGLYLALGEPTVPDQPIAERRTRDMLSAGASAEQVASLADATARLEKRLENRPEDAAGWFLLGRSYLTMRQYPEAMRAFGRAQQLAPDQPDIIEAYVEAAIANNGGRIDKNAHEALHRLLALEPTNPKAPFLLALERAQNGDLAGAVQGWSELLASAPPDAPWVPTVLDHLNRAAAQAGIALPSAKSADGAPAPSATSKQQAGLPKISAEDVTTAEQMVPEDRQRMVRGMVERLASRLADHPDDIDGWRRLARAWEVLDEPEKAAEARARVAALERR